MMTIIWFLPLLLVGQSVAISPDVSNLCDEYWEWRLADRPEFATYVGVHDYDDKLDDDSLEAHRKRLEKCKGFLDRATQLEAELTEDADIVNIQVLKYELDTYIVGFDLKGYYLPINFEEGVHVDIEKLFSWMPRNIKEDYNKMLARLTKLPKKIDEVIDALKMGMKEGITYHSISMKGMDKKLGKFVVKDPTDSPVYAFFKDDFPDSMAAAEIENIQKKAQTVIEGQVTPAFELLRDFVVNKYKTRKDISVTSMSNGKRFYEELLWFYTSTNKTAEEIHELGHSEVKRIEGEMQKIVEHMGYSNLSTQAFSNIIRDDPNNYYKTPEEVLEAYKNISYDLIPPRLPRIFKDIPKAKLRVETQDSDSGVQAYYDGPSYDGSRPGVFQVNTYDPHYQPKYTMLSVSLFSGNPGIHLQASHNVENPDSLWFRRAIDDRLYGVAPSRFPLYTYYVHGWAMYATKLGASMDLYGYPLDKYGHYSEEMVRACRLVVDTGIHAMGWSKAAAFEYLFRHTASSTVDIKHMIDLFITRPAWAVSAMVGKQEILALKENAMEYLGDGFDIKEFHDIVLDSYGPINVVEYKVDEWTYGPDFNNETDSS